jgi:hypothetical protein
MLHDFKLLLEAHQEIALGAAGEHFADEGAARRQHIFGEVERDFSERDNAQVIR